MTVYHIQCEQENPEILSLDYITDQPLFVCRNDREWFPQHIPEVVNHVYEIETNLTVADIFQTDSFEYYLSLSNFSDTSTNGARELTAKGMRLAKLGFKCFELLADNDSGELSEMLILKPTESIVDIKVIPHMFRPVL